MKNWFYSLACLFIVTILNSCGSKPGLLSVGSMHFNLLGYSSNEDISFNEFLSHFKESDLPLSIEKDHLDNFIAQSARTASWKKNKIAEKYELFVPQVVSGRFSRMPVQNDCYYVAKLNQTNQYIAVSFTTTSTQSYGYKSDKPSTLLNYIIMTYTPEGEIIDEQKVASSGYSHSFTTCRIDKNMKINTERYEVYRKGEEPHLKQTITYQIEEDGKIVVKNNNSFGKKKALEQEEYNY